MKLSTGGAWPGRKLTDGPRGMFAHERFTISLGRVLQHGQGRCIPAVAQRDADIAQETPALDSLDRRVAKELAELLFVPRQELHQGRQRAALKLAYG